MQSGQIFKMSTLAPTSKLCYTTANGDIKDLNGLDDPA